jgi:hypothetical protein
VLSLVWHWSMTGSHTEILTWMDFVLALPGTSVHPLSVFVRASRALSLLASGQADFSADGPQTEGFASIAEELHQAPEPAWAALTVIGPVLSFFSGESKRALRLSEDLSDSPDPWIRAAVRTMSAGFAENSGDLESMRVDVDAALRDFEVIGDRWGLSTTLSSRGWIRTLDGDIDGAIADYERAFDCLKALGGDEDDLLIHIRLTGLRMRTGDLSGARASLAAARGTVTSGPHGAVRQLVADGVEAHLLLLEGDRAGALAICDHLRQQIADRSQGPWMRGHLCALTLSVTAGVALRVGDVDQAARDMTVAYPQALGTQDLPVIAIVGVWVAGVALFRDRPTESATILGAAARLRGGDDFTDPGVSWLLRLLRETLAEDVDTAYQAGKVLSIDDCLAIVDPAPYV